MSTWTVLTVAAAEFHNGHKLHEEHRIQSISNTRGTAALSPDSESGEKSYESQREYAPA